MARLTPNFTYEEMTVSSEGDRRAIPNTPNPAQLVILRNTAVLMEKVRTVLGAPIYVNSAFRSIAVNKLVGGVPQSAHTMGYGVDFTAKGLECFDAATKIAASNLSFDQLILGPTWIHISFDPKRRRNLLTEMAPGGPYVQGIKA